MAQRLQRSESDDEPGLMLEINTTPLIDVLLVLLVMLIITIPVQLHAVKMALPTASATTPPATGDVIAVEIDAESNILWQGQRCHGRAAGRTVGPSWRRRPKRKKSSRRSRYGATRRHPTACSSKSWPAPGGMVCPGLRCWAPRCLRLDRLQPALPAGRWCAPVQRCRMGVAHAFRRYCGL